ncbi:hypothetical protein HMN09_00774600 [Mycena chlorophos]|uniref:Sec39 domain-containing protein n=1 Tax=Mycena chlorophos TaxID=658473 RepID=A0A8H6STS4_MYCCL|nr:hypothetical protein HMN09_00774600 [Mycena chlorophos]
MGGPVRELRRILASWKDDRAESPECLGYVLKRTYRRTLSFDAKALSGADALLLKNLAPLAAELGFALHLAHLDGTSYNSCRIKDSRWRSQSPCGSEDEDREDDFVDSDSVEESVELKGVVDLEGMPVRVVALKDLRDWDEVLFGRPMVDDGESDDEEFEDHDGKEGSRTKTWHRTALLLWPTNGKIHQSVGVGDVYEHAFHRLSSISQSPSAPHTAVVERLLERCRVSDERVRERMEDRFGIEKDRAPKEEAANIGKALGVLQKCAEEWNDAGLFLRALEVCRVVESVALLGVEELVSAYKAFGWTTLVDFCDTAVRDNKSGSRADIRAMVSRMVSLAVEENDAELASWARKEEDCLLTDLGSIAEADIPWMIEIITGREAETFRETLLPQLAAQNHPVDFWVSFVSQAHAAANTSPTVAACVTQCAEDLVAGLAAFPTKLVASTFPKGYLRSDKNSAETLRVVQLCLEIELPELCARIFVKMLDASRTGAFSPQFPPWLYYAELATPVGEILAADNRAEMRELFRPFFEGVVCSLLSGEMHVPNGPGTITPCPLAERHLRLLIDAVHAGGGLEFLNGLLPDALKGRDWETIQSLERVIMRCFPSHPALRETKLALVQARIPSDILTLNPAQMVRLVELYLDVNAVEQVEVLLARVAAPIVSADSETRRVLLAKLGHDGELLMGMAAVLKTRGMDFKAEPFLGFASTIVRLYVEGLGEEPASGGPTYAELEQLGCRGANRPVAGRGAGGRRSNAAQPAGPCPSCAELKVLLRDEQQAELWLSISAAASVHLGQHFSATQKWGCVWQASSAGLKIVKPENLWAYPEWQARRSVVGRILSSVGDPAAQAEILGDDFARINSRVHGMVPAQVSLKRNASSVDSEGSAKKTRVA